MRIGLKLDLDFDKDQIYQRLYGGHSVPLRLREAGVEAVEFPLGPSTDLRDAADKARVCREVGLQVSLHPYTEKHEANPAHFEGPRSVPAVIHQRFLALAAELSRDQGETVVNIHPAAGSADLAPRADLQERSVQFFAWANGWCCDNAPEVRPVAELQVAPDLEEELIRIGDRPSELSLIVNRSGVGACWDVGHAEWNHRRFGTSKHPGGELWRRIAHVHCHDVDQADHQVLRRGEAHWQRFLQELSETDFVGTVIIEVAPLTFLEAGGWNALTESIAVLKEAAGRTSK